LAACRDDKSPAIMKSGVQAAAEGAACGSSGTFGRLQGLRGRKGLNQAGTLARQRLVPLVGFIREEDRLWLAVRPEGNRLGRRVLTPEPGEDARRRNGGPV
jgi:hypothetical protein